MGTPNSPGAQGRGPSLAPHLHMGVCFWGIGAQTATMGSCPQPHSGWVKGTLGIGVTAGRSHRMGGTSLVGWTESKCLKSRDPQPRQTPKQTDTFQILRLVEGWGGQSQPAPGPAGLRGAALDLLILGEFGFGPVSAQGLPEPMTSAQGMHPVSLNARCM